MRHDGVFEGVHVGAVDLLEALVGLLLAVEQLQHDDAGDVFLQVGVDLGDGDANAAVAVADLAAEDRGGVEDERQHGEGDQRQPPAHVQHDDENAQQDEDVFEDRDHAGGEHFVQRVHVAGDAGDQAADRVLVEEGDVQALQVAEDLAAQIEHHLLSGPLHDVGLGELEQEAEQQNADVDAGNLRDAGQRPGAEKAIEQGMGFGVVGKVLIDGDFRQVRAENVGAGLEHDRDQRNDHLHPVGTQVDQQALHQPAVVCLA